MVASSSSSPSMIDGTAWVNASSHGAAMAKIPTSTIRVGESGCPDQPSLESMARTRQIDSWDRDSLIGTAHVEAHAPAVSRYF